MKNLTETEQYFFDKLGDETKMKFIRLLDQQPDEFSRVLNIWDKENLPFKEKVKRLNTKLNNWARPKNNSKTNPNISSSKTENSQLDHSKEFETLQNTIAELNDLINVKRTALIKLLNDKNLANLNRLNDTEHNYTPLGSKVPITVNLDLILLNSLNSLTLPGSAITKTLILETALTDYFGNDFLNLIKIRYSSTNEK